MQNFDPEKLTAEVAALKEVFNSTVPAEEFANVISTFEARLLRLENAVFAAAGVGSAEATGAVLDATELKAEHVGEYSKE